MRTGWTEDPFDRACQSDSFETFVRKCLEAHPGHVSGMYRQYTDGVDYVGRIETAAEALIWILTQLDETFEPNVIYETPPVNVMAGDPDLDKRCRYSPRLLDQIIAAEREAIERFGYSMGASPTEA